MNRGAPNFFAGLFGVYVYYGANALGDCDSGEFIALAKHGGVAHPPGYPLLVLFLRLGHLIWSWMPSFNLIEVLSACSAIVVVAAASLMHRVVLGTYKLPLSAMVAVLFVFVSAEVFRAATGIEPFGLNLFLACALIFNLWRFYQDPYRQRPIIFMGLLFGLAFCTHHSFAMLLPMLVPVFFLTRGGVAPAKKVGLFFAGAAVGGLPYLYCFFHDPSSPLVWGDWTNIGGAIDHILRREYGTLSLAATADGAWYNGPLLAASHFGSNFIWVGSVFVAIGIGKSALEMKDRGFEGAQQKLELSILLGAIASGILFTSLFRLGDDPTAQWIARRFYALPFVLLTLFLAKGLTEFERLEYPLLYKRALLVALCMAQVLIQIPDGERRSEIYTEQFAKDIYATIGEEGGLLVTDGDVDFFTAFYGKHVLGLGVNTQIVQAWLFHLPWYQKRLMDTGVIEQETDSLQELIVSNLRKRPIYLVNPLERFQVHHPDLQQYPIGPLIRVSHRADPIPSPVTLIRESAQLMEGTLNPPSREQVDGMKTWEKMVLSYYRTNWESLAKSAKEAGLGPEATFATEIAKQFKR